MTSLSLPLPLPAEHPCYAGHFPGRPIVPGALLLQCLCVALADRAWAVQGARSLKFLAPLLPGDGCEAVLEPRSTPGQWSLRIWRGADLVASGVLLLAGGPE